MTDGATHQWAKKFRDEEKRCPWPGPRPLRTTDEHLLIGRDTEFEEFSNEVRRYNLVSFRGASGVGKSSILDALLVPTLRKERYFVAVCRNWGGQAGADARTYLRQNVFAEIPTKLRRRFSEPSRIFEELEEQYGRNKKAVVILDQFEELVRYNQSLLKGIVDYILELTRTTEIRIVVSFRSEFLHEMTALELGVQPFKFSRYELLPVDAKYAEEIALSGVRDGSSAITQDAATQLASWYWTATEGGSSSDSGWTGVGLLHLQGLLYTLDDQSRHTLITMADVEEFRSKCEIKQVSGQAVDTEMLLRLGLEESVEIKLRRAHKAAVDSGLDPFLIEGTAQQLANAVTHLSSGGYKLVRAVTELARASTKSQQEVLGGGLQEADLSEETRSRLDGKRAGGGSAPFDALVTTVTEGILTDNWFVADEDKSNEADDPPHTSSLGLCLDRRGIAARADEVLGVGPFWLDLLREGEPPGRADPIGTCVGPMAGQSQAATLIEELRRFAFAVLWLRECSLVRITRPGDRTAMVSLIHDGFGDALESWSERETRSDVPLAVLSLTAPAGRAFMWWDLEQEHPRAWGQLCGTEDDPKVHVNISLQGNSVIGAHFKGVVFANCDFRGAYFHKCTFEGVAFLNCRLDGSMLSDCTIRKPTGQLPDARDVSVPTDYPAYEPCFVVGEGHGDGKVSLGALPAIFANYRADQGQEPANSFFLQMAGRPATSVRPQDWTEEQKDSWDVPSGGLVIYGSRLSAMSMRKLVFTEGGQLSLRGVSGSGLDVVEMQDLQPGDTAGAAGTVDVVTPLKTWIELRGCSLRGVSFSTANDTRASNVHIDVRDSVVAQMNFGDGLDSGSCQIINSLVVQAWNGSHIRSGSTFHVAASGCRVLDLVGVSADAKCQRFVIADRAADLPIVESGPALLDAGLKATTYRRYAWPKEAKETAGHGE